MYLGLTGWLCNYIAHYAQKPNPNPEALHRKVVLLRSSPSNKGRTRKLYSQRTVVESSTDDELNSYRQLQDSLRHAANIFLIHFDRLRTLYIDIDASKQRLPVI